MPIPPAFDQRWHETLEGYSDRSRRLLHRIHEIGGGEPHEMTGDDLVHPDYNLGNVLFDEYGQVSGVVDWNWGVARGDRRFALLGLSINLATEGDQHGVQQDAIDRLDEILDTTIDPTLLCIYWAYWTLYNVHWSIHNNFLPERIDHDLRLAESYLT